MTSFNLFLTLKNYFPKRISCKNWRRHLNHAFVSCILVLFIAASTHVITAQDRPSFTVRTYGQRNVTQGYSGIIAYNVESRLNIATRF